MSRRLVGDSQLTGKCCLIVRIDNTVLLAEKTRIHVNTPYLNQSINQSIKPLQCQYPRRSQAQWRDSQISVQQQNRGNSSGLEI